MPFLVEREREREREREIGCFTLIVSLMSCGCYCFVASPYGVVGWSAVCECGMSGSYPLFVEQMGCMGTSLAEN